VCPRPLRRQVVKAKVLYSDRRYASTCIGLVKFSDISTYPLVVEGVSLSQPLPATTCLTQVSQNNT
jgi:hypothetical protein